MKQRILYAGWAILYVVCTCLGFAKEPTDAQSVAMTILSLVFFVPGFWLVADATHRQSRRGLLAIRWISIASLALTVLAFIANLASAAASDAVGNALYTVLIIVSAPMICMQIELLSLFLWACLLFSTWVFGAKGHQK